MNKKDLLIPLIIVGALILIVCLFLFLGNRKANNITAPLNNLNDSNQIIFFYGEGCPHCAEVEKFFQQENIRSKINFQSLEVYQNKDNANLMLQKAEGCGLKPEELGMPFLFDPGKCLVGDQPIIDYFKSKTSQQ